MDKLKYKKIITYVSGIVLLIPMLTIGSINIYKNVNEYKQEIIKEEEYLNSGEGHQKLAHYNSIVVPNYISIRGKNIEKLIKNSTEKVIILDADAVVFNIPHNVYYKNYTI